MGLAPNHYKLQDAGNTITVEWWVGSKLVVTQSPDPAQTFTGSEITIGHPPIGTLVSVITQTFPDGQNLVTVLIPTISLQFANQDVSFQTIGIKTRRSNPNEQIYGPL